MLQQTQVNTVRPYFRRFLRRFPSLRALAGADVQDVLKAWEGLGYYARARNLHRAARHVVTHLHGRIPRSAAALLELPGVGDYTAAAIASISFGEPVPAVDGNVLRVMTRFRGWRDDITRPATRRKVRDHLAERIPADAASSFNQALMETGALVCKPGTPNCRACPLRRWCRARTEGTTDQLPVRPPRQAPPHVEALAVVIRKGQRVLIVQRPPRGMLGGLWEFPGARLRPGEARRAAARRLAADAGLQVSTPTRLADPVQHAYSHFTTRVHVQVCSWIGGRLRTAAGQRGAWCTATGTRAYPLTTVARKIAAHL
jgi:A/G-specific adenine glycosylase